MNAPLVWIVFPVLMAGFLALLSERERWMRGVAMAIPLGMALGAQWIPIGRTLTLGPLSLEISPQMIFFGRRFFLDNADRPLLVLVYLLLALWFLLSFFHHTPRKLYPLGLVSISLVLTGYAVEPVYYAAIFYGYLTMASVILLSPAGSLPSKGVLRFLAFQVLGMISILFAAWLLSWVDVDTADINLLTRTMVLMGLGFSFLLGIFPFNSWISMISEDNHPYLVSFVFNIYLNGVLLFAMKYLTETDWLLNVFDLLKPIQLVGLLMVAVGGVSAIFVSHLGRMIGAAVITELGRSLLVISLFPDGQHLYFSSLVLQGVSFGLWSLALSTYRQEREDLTYSRVEGIGTRFPIRTVGMFCGFFTLAGLPFLGGFPLHWEVGTLLIENAYWPLWPFFMGNVGLILGGLRMLSVLSHGENESGLPQPSISAGRIFVLIGSFWLLLVGLFPHILSRWVAPMAAIFQ